MKNQNRIQTRAKWLLSLGALLATGVSSAWAFTPAGTEIRNQSTATYLDAANTPQIATSNEVINTVAPLYSVVVTPNATGASGFFAYDGTPALTQVSAPGNVAYYSYILENTGNAPDRFNADVRTRAAGGAVIAPSAAGIEIYYDANGNGFVDAGDVLLDNSLAGSAASTPIVNPGQKIPLVVAVHTPSAATAAQRIETDFQVTGVNGSAQDAASNWNRTTFAPGVGVVTAYKSADVTSAAPGRQDVTYTIQGSNTGSAAVSSVIFVPGVNDVDTTGDGTADIVQGILIEDVLDITKIDVGADYANINPITTGGQISPSTAVPLFWDDANSLWTATKPTQAASTSAGDIGKYKIALFIPDADSVGGSGNGASDPVLSPGQSYRMSFTVDIRSGIAATTLENEVSGQYISGGITRDFESNVHIIEIGGDSNTTTVDVELSPYTFLNGTTANLSAITNGAARGSLQHPGVDALGLNASADTTSAGSELDADAHRNAGTTVVFPLTLTNPVATSSATDVFNISIVSGVPAGWTATLFKADGITPLADTNGDSRPDVGEVVPGGVVDLVVKVVIPDNSPAVPAASVITVRATSVKRNLGAAVVTDDTLLRIPEVRPAGVDIAVRGQVSGDNAVQTTATATADDDDDATGTAVQPGSNVAYAIQVANIRNATQNASGVDEITSAVDTYQLTVTKVGGAAPFDVVLFRDLNGDGVLDASELNPISDTGFLSPVTPLTGAPLAVGTANLFNLLARVTVPSETPAGDYFVDVTATSTNRSAQADTMRLLVRVVAAPSISVIPDNTATVVRGGSVTFKHVVVNTGNTTGTVQLSTAFPAGLFPTGYTAVFVSDTGAILGTDGVTYVTPSLAPNQSQEFYVRIFVPANASVGATVPLTITGSGTAGGATLGAATDDAVDIITVIDGSLDLQKTNSPTGAVLPGGTIGYTTVFKNLGGASITDVVVFDAIPANSTFVATSLGTSGLPAGVTATLEYSTNNGVSWTAVEPAATSVTNVRVKLVRTAALGVPLNGLLPGESGSFTFQVTVK